MINQNNEAEYDLLIYVANWPKKRRNAWKTLLCARAIENQCYVIGVNRVGLDNNSQEYSGDSMIINPMGEIDYHKENVEDVYTTVLNKNNLSEIRNNFPFLSDADSFNIYT
jgi:predicted amidohydrolase